MNKLYSFLFLVFVLFYSSYAMFVKVPNINRVVPKYVGIRMYNNFEYAPPKWKWTEVMDHCSKTNELVIQINEQLKEINNKLQKQEIELQRLQLLNKEFYDHALNHQAALVTKK